MFSLLLQGVALSQSVPFQTMDQGEISYFNYGDPDFLGADMVINDRNTWKWFWEKHTQGVQPSPPIPRINFQREMVLVVLLGFQGSGGGPSVEIASIEALANLGTIGEVIAPRRWSPMNLRVIVKENREPGLLTVITNPYHIVKVRRNILSVIFEHGPKGKPCAENVQCDSKEYCEKRSGDCNGIGFCKPRPEGCVMLYDPVCGCDGKTYGNGCVAASEGVSILHRGRCEVTIPCMKNEDCPSNEFCLFPVGTCVGPGTCTPKPQACPLYFAPCRLEDGICGCDGISYCNLCEAYANGASVLKMGGCSLEQGCIGSGGTVTTALCCQSVGDFPSTCGIGACGCAPENSHQVKTCDCGIGKCFDGSRCVPLGAP
jgi:hypothetical protein